MSTSELGQAATADTSVTKPPHSQTMVMITEITTCSNNFLSARLIYSTFKAYWSRDAPTV
jgi:hypothetical protein